MIMKALWRKTRSYLPSQMIPGELFHMTTVLGIHVYTLMMFPLAKNMSVCQIIIFSTSTVWEWHESAKGNLPITFLKDRHYVGFFFLLCKYGTLFLWDLKCHLYGLSRISAHSVSTNVKMLSYPWVLFGFIFLDRLYVSVFWCLLVPMVSKVSAFISIQRCR